ncbi:MAG: leucine-rich repeat domain-containing protein [Clostridia bacterium]|nr:leucine-rich repeat domain-containing protein [Clostridia bacterium]
MNKKLRVLLYIFISIFVCSTSIGSIFAQGADQGGTPNGSELHAFYPTGLSYSPELEKYMERLDSVTFAWGRLFYNDLESVTTTKGRNDNTMFYYPEDYLKPVKFAKSKGKSIQINIFTDGYNAERILPDASSRGKAVQAVINLLKQDIGKDQSLYYDGVVVDFEGLRNTDDQGNKILYNNQPISSYFNLFLKELNGELDKINKMLYVAVNPRIYYDGFDYKEIVKIADRMIVMAHDYEPSTALKKSEVAMYTGFNTLEPIDSPAPAGKVRMALEDVKNSISSTEMNKVWLQIAFDSAQWRFDLPDGSAWNQLEDTNVSKDIKLTPTYAMIKKRIDNADGNGIGIGRGFNNELQSPFIEYFNKQDKTYNILVYEDSISIASKINLAKTYQLGGISLWGIGNIPDYNDTNGKSYHLDVWENILKEVKSKGASGIKQGDMVQFKDKKLEEAIRSKLSKDSGSINRSELESIYRFKLPAGVSDISDLKYLVNLEYLDAQSSGITNISPLSSLVNLKALYLQRNQISDIAPLKGLTKLQVLSLNGNAVSKVDALSGLKDLRELYLRENQITGISTLNSLTKLSKLYLSLNRIQDISSLSNLNSLQELCLEGNKIGDIKPLSQLNNLKYLSLANNKVTEVNSLKALNKLETLYLQRNSIREISTIEGFKELKELSLNGNQIEDIKALSKLTKMKKLYMTDNKIKDISSLRDMKGLETLYLGGNNISDYSPVKSFYSTIKDCDFTIK